MLSQANYHVVRAETAEQGRALLQSQQLELLLLDLGLPDRDGLDLLRDLRLWTDIPVLVVSARDGEGEKVQALDLGADDYVTKPFASAELLARIRVCLRRRQQLPQPEQALLTAGDIRMDCERHQVFLKSEPIHLSPLEYALLQLLLRNKGRVLSTKFIIAHIYGPNYGSDTQALRALMAGLRRKVEELPSQPRHIQTEIGIGYRLVE